MPKINYVKVPKFSIGDIVISKNSSDSDLYLICNIIEGRYSIKWISKHADDIAYHHFNIEGFEISIKDTRVGTINTCERKALINFRNEYYQLNEESVEEDNSDFTNTDLQNIIYI